MTLINPRHMNFVVSDLNAITHKVAIGDKDVIISAQMMSPVNEELLVDFDVKVTFETFAGGKQLHALNSELINVKGSIHERVDHDLADAEAELFLSQLEEHDLALLFNHSSFEILAAFPGENDEHFLVDVVLPNDPHHGRLDIDNEDLRDIKRDALHKLHESLGLPDLYESVDSQDLPD